MIDAMLNADAKHLQKAAEQALKAKLAHARALPWFVERCPDIMRVTGFSDLERLAPLELENDDDRITLSLLAQASHDMPGGGLTLTSGGSTGGKKQITHSWEFNRRVMALGCRMFGAAKPPSAMVNCLTAGEMQGAFLFACGIAEQSGIRLLPAGWAMHPAQLSELIATHRVDALAATPSFAAGFLGHPDIPVKPLQSLRQLLFIGEPCSTALRGRLLERLPQVLIRSLGYSSTETGPIGFQCPYLDGDQYHLHADAVHVEVLDANTLLPVAEGENGELVITPLLPNHMPIFRYRIGDRGRFGWTGEVCACGSQMPVLTLLGRTEASIKLGGAIVTQHQVMQLLHQVLPQLEVGDVQVQIDSSNAHGLQVTLALAESRVTRGNDSEFESLLRNDAYASMLPKLPGLGGVSIRPMALAEFLRTPAGKTPFFIEISRDG